MEKIKLENEKLKNQVYGLQNSKKEIKIMPKRVRQLKESQEKQNLNSDNEMKRMFTEEKF